MAKITDADLEEACTRFDFESPTIRDNFFDVGAHMVEKCPVAHTEDKGGYWVISGYSEALAADKDWEHFTNTNGVMVPPAEGAAPMYPPDLDPPKLKEFRALLMPHFLVKRMNQIEDESQVIADSLAAELAGQPRCDFHRDFAVPLPQQIFLKLIIHANDEEYSEISEHAGVIFSAPDPAVVAQAYADFSKVVGNILERRRHEPRIDDVVDSIIHGTVEGRPLTKEEQAATLFPLAAGGFDTTTSVLSSSVAYLAEHPKLQEELASDLSLIPAATEEFLRLFASALIGRTVAQQVTLDGHVLNPGEGAILAFPFANRDPEVFNNPGEFRLSRPNINQSLTFGLGLHRCPGANAARLYMRVGLRAILKTLTDIALDGPVTWEAAQVTSPTSVPIRYGAK